MLGGAILDKLRTSELASPAQASLSVRPRTEQLRFELCSRLLLNSRVNKKAQQDVSSKGTTSAAWLSEFSSHSGLSEELCKVLCRLYSELDPLEVARVFSSLSEREIQWMMTDASLNPRNSKRSSEYSIETLKRQVAKRHPAKLAEKQRKERAARAAAWEAAEQRERARREEEEQRERARHEEEEQRERARHEEEEQRERARHEEIERAMQTETWATLISIGIKPSPELVNRWGCLAAEEILDAIDRGFPDASTYSKDRGIKADFSEIELLTPRQRLIARRGSSLRVANKLADLDTSIQPILDWLDLGFAGSELLTWEGSGVTVSVALKWRKAGFSIDQFMEWTEAGFSNARVAKKWSETGVSPRIAARRQAAGVRP